MIRKTFLVLLLFLAVSKFGRDAVPPAQKLLDGPVCFPHEACGPGSLR